VIEPDSLPNLVTNLNLAPCAAANSSGVYVKGVQHAINTFHAIPNAYLYLDIGHSAWLGWPNNANAAVTLFTSVVSGATAGLSSIDGFIDDTANYTPLKEPFINASQSLNGTQVISANFYSFNPTVDEAGYATELQNLFRANGWPVTSTNFITDTSRNGWGGTNRPTAASTSTDVNTFVDASRIDRRNHRGQWCNQSGAGMGIPPLAAPPDFPRFQAYVWIKPPGESDGTYPGSANQMGAVHADPNCDPAQTNPLAGNTLTGSIPNSPPAGQFFTAEFIQNIQNSFPQVPSDTTPSFTVFGNGTSVVQGATATTSITVLPVNNFSGAVALSISGLPAGVTAAFSPASLANGSGTSTLTFTAATNATVPATPAMITVTGTSGTITKTTTFSLTVVGRPDFSVSASPASISIAAGMNPTSNITVASLFGFNGNVSLSASGLPTGVSANFSPLSVNASGTIVVNFTAQASTPTGTTNISIVGTSGTLVHAATIAFTVTGPDFTLSANPAIVAVMQGKSASSTITVTPGGGFNGSVALSASGMLAGVTASFAGNVVTFTASATATTGISTVTITGASGALTRTTTISLGVTSGQPDFSLSASPASVLVNQGSTVTSVITVTPSGGFSGSVALSASGLPTGVTAVFSPASTTGSSTLTLSASSTATLGAATVTITGTGGTHTHTATIALTVNPPQVGNGGAGYWHTSGNQILDSNNQPIRLAGVNWYGFETPDHLIHGLWAQDYKTILNTIKNNGYNVIRIPFSSEMVESNPVPTNFTLSAGGVPANTDLKGLTSLQILDKIIGVAGTVGLRVILDHHRSEAGASAEANGLWYTSAFSDTAWINDWVALTNRYLNNTTVIGMDLHNEPHNATNGGACWGCGTPANDWRLAAQRAGNAILGINPKLLIFVEGTDCFNGDCDWWGGNLQGVSQFPVVLNVPNQLVYSAHDYGPSLFQQPWFNSSTTTATLNAHFAKNWGFIYTGKTAPIWVGEFGAGNAATDTQNTAAGSEGQWFSSLVQYIAASPGMGWTYWALNGEDSFSLLDSNYNATPVSPTKQQLLASIQFPLSGGSGGGGGGGSTTPTISSINPTSALPGASITITGTNFSATANANTVTFGSATAIVTAATTTSLTVTVPNIAAGAVNVTVSVAGKSSNAVAFTVNASNGGGGGSACHITYAITNQWSTGFQVAITINNTGTTALNNWTLAWTFPGNQQIANLWNGGLTQTGASVTVTNLSYNGNIPAGGSYNAMGFTANGAAATPASFSLNGVHCQ